MHPLFCVTMSTTAKKRAHNAASLRQSAATAEELAAITKALGHPARIHIVRVLLEKQSCIGSDVVDEIGLAQSTASEHLRILRATGIILKSSPRTSAIR